MEVLVKSCNICWVLSCVPEHANILQNNKVPLTLERVVYLLHVVTHLWKLQCYAVLIGMVLHAESSLK